MRYLTENDLRKAIDKKIGYELSNDAWRNYGPNWNPPYDDSDLRDVIRNIPQQVKPKVPNRKTAYVHADLIPKTVLKRVQAIRIELFGKPSAPFHDLEAMDQWIKQQAALQPAPEGHAPRYGYKMEPGTSYEELQKLMISKPGYYGIEYATLDYPTKSEVIGSIVVSDGTSLRKLWLAVRWVADRLDCQDAQATAYILAGLKPLLNPLKVEIQPTFYKDGPSTGKIIMTIREPLSAEEVTKAYKKARRKLWGQAHNHQLPNDKDYALLKFVQSRLIPDNPHWESIRLQWNRQYKDWSFDHWRFLKVTYERAKDKIYPPIRFGPVTIKN